MANVLSDGEAMMFARSSNWGDQPTLAWFRAIFGSSTDTWRAGYNGFPKLQHLCELGTLKTETWKLVNAKGKVAKHILKRLNAKEISKATIYVQDKDVAPELGEENFGKDSGHVSKIEP